MYILHRNGRALSTAEVVMQLMKEANNEFWTQDCSFQTLLPNIWVYVTIWCLNSSSLAGRESLFCGSSVLAPWEAQISVQVGLNVQGSELCVGVVHISSSWYCKSLEQRFLKILNRRFGSQYWACGYTASGCDLVSFYKIRRVRQGHHLDW